MTRRTSHSLEPRSRAPPLLNSSIMPVNSSYSTSVSATGRWLSWRAFQDWNSSDMVLSSHWLFRLLATDPRTVDSTPSISDVCEFSWICAVILVKPSFSVRPLLTSPLMFTSPSLPRGSLPLPFLLLLVFASKPDTGSGEKTQNRRCGLTTKNELHLFGNSSRCLFNQQ